MMNNDDEQQQTPYTLRKSAGCRSNWTQWPRKAYAFVQRERCVYVRIYSMFEFTEELESRISTYATVGLRREKQHNLSTKSFHRSHSSLISGEIRSKLYSIGQPVNGNVETPLSRRKCSDSYEMVQVLGEGQYGMVTKARKRATVNQLQLRKYQDGVGRKI